MEDSYETRPGVPYHLGARVEPPASLFFACEPVRWENAYPSGRLEVWGRSALFPDSGRSAWELPRGFLVGQMTTTTALLSVLIHEGDDVAWTEFVRRYQPILIAVGLRLGLREPDAVDVAQQTLLEFVRDLRRGGYDRSRGRLRNWLLTIANHRVRDHQRALARHDGGPTKPASTSASESERLEQVWESEERRALLAEAMLRLRGQTSLDERTIRAFELTALRGVPAETVAQECAMSIAQVYVARNRAATRLREIVGELEALYSESAGPEGAVT